MIAEKFKPVGPEEIIATAEMLFRSQGFDNTTAQDISNLLNISDSHFFHYFESVDEVLELLWSGVVQY